MGFHHLPPQKALVYRAWQSGLPVKKHGAGESPTSLTAAQREVTKSERSPQFPQLIIIYHQASFLLPTGLRSGPLCTDGTAQTTLSRMNHPRTWRRPIGLSPGTSLMMLKLTEPKLANRIPGYSVACIGSALGSPNLAVNHAWQHSGAVLKAEWN